MRSDMLRCTTGCGAVSVSQGLDSLPKIAEQMPPVGDLNGVRSALADPVGIGAGTIAGDNLDAQQRVGACGNRVSCCLT